MSLDYKYGIELIVLHGRVGFLSICFAGHPALDVTEVRALQYHLSHMKYRTPVLRIPHPDLDAFAPSGELPLEKEYWLTDPLEGRLGRPGQPFTLVEVRDLLLDPIHSSIANYEQNQFLVHTVLRFDKHTSFADPVLRSAYAQELVAFAQIEEADHAPAAPDNLGLPNEVLNANHLAAYSYLGGAHFVADQWDRDDTGGSFDADRVEGVQRKYCTAFLATVTERLIAHSFLEEAVRRRLDRVSISDIWERFTEFEAAAQLIDVSRREAVNRCYRLAQRAQRIPETIASLHRVFRDAQASEQAHRQAAMLARQTEQAEHQGQMLERQNQLALQQHQMLQAQEETRRRLGLIEIFIVTVYTAELAHILGTTAEFNHKYTFLGVAGLSVLALLTVIRHHRQVMRGTPGTRSLLAATWLALLLWLAAGFAWEWKDFLHAPDRLHPVIIHPSPPKGALDQRVPSLTNRGQ
ncbi:MAG TPA: hypothetical protein VEU96_00595 [Bryobacteraceae bacterium]|nr:hypothetical protein [Bryobacteraceae bacterium]